jgi:DNA topoisomerase-6 subunit B
MLQKTKRQTLSRFFPNDFCRVTPALADEICKAARVLPKAKLREIRGAIAETY